jgi:hypothetical protein
MVLCRSSLEESNEDFIRVAGGIHALVKCLSDSDAGVRGSSLLALYNLAYNDQNALLLRELGGIELTIQLFADVEERVRRYAAVLCANFLILPELFEAFQRSGGLAPLLRLLSDESVVVREESLLAMKGICYWKVHVINMLFSSHPEVMSAVRQVLVNKETVESQHYAIGTIWNMTFSSFVRTDIVSREPILVASLVASLSSNCSDIINCAAGALCNLAYENDQNRDAIRDAGGVKALTKLLDHDSIDVRIQAAGALSKRGLNIGSIEDKFDLKISEQGSTIVSCSDPSHALAVLVSSISDESMATKKISRLVPCLMLLSDTDADVIARRKASITMLHLSKECNNHEFIRDGGGVDTLSKLMLDSDADIVNNVSEALKYFKTI